MHFRSFAFAALISVALLTWAASARGQGRPYMQNASLPCEDAHQAAAADGEYVYAVSSRRVARLDRTSGQPLGISTGEAQHLNSGFLHEDRLYCAHSNYPQVPEQSELMVLDPRTMALTTFHDFGNSGGSLTWAVYEQGHWWCNFARYGENNGETFLVKFDSEWQPRGRWTYPVEVIRELGTKSISGGVWQSDSLLVTGHDDPVVFRLRLPREGSVLELVKKLAVPFTGQGIALDRQSGGLVGIDRKRRQVLFATQRPLVTASEVRPLRLRVLTYNLHHGEGTDGRLDLERIAGVIRGAEPDVVALQEVDRRAERTGSVDQPAELARLTGLRVAFGANISLQGGDYGNAVLSRFPIVRQVNHRLPGPANIEQRGVLEVELLVPGRETPLVLLATHFDHRPDDGARLASTAVLEEWIKANSQKPASSPEI